MAAEGASLPTEGLPPLPVKEISATGHERALVCLNEVCDEWVRTSKAPTAAHSWRLMIYGSFRLGVFTENSDIDVCCVGPRALSHDDFFDGRLQRMLATHPDINDVSSVPDTFIPLITLVACGIKVDLLYASLPFPLPTSPHVFDHRPEIDVYDQLTHRYLNTIADDVRTVLSVRGPRKENRLLALLPDIPTFTRVLAYIRRWSKAKCVNSMNCCFPGGFAWAILVGKICLMFHGQSAEALVVRFFETYAAWPYPEPILLEEITEVALTADGGIKPWCREKNPHHYMPILAPVYPPDNLARTVSRSGLRVCTRELKNAVALIASSLGVKPPVPPAEGDGAASAAPAAEPPPLAELWERLLAPTEFLRMYPNYIEIELYATTKRDLRDWEARMLSQLRQLISELETIFVHAHPCPRTVAGGEEGDWLSRLFIGWTAVPNNKHQPTKDEVVGQTTTFCGRVEGWTGRTGTMAITARHYRRKELPDYARSVES